PRLGTSAQLAPQPREARRRTQFKRLCLLAPRDPQCFFKGSFRFLKPIKTRKRFTFETMKFRGPLSVTCPFLGSKTLCCSDKGRTMLMLARQRFCEPGKHVQTKSHCAEPAGKSVAQASRALLVRSLCTQNRTAQEPWLKIEPEPLLRREGLGSLQLSQSQCW